MTRRSRRGLINLVAAVLLAAPAGAQRPSPPTAPHPAFPQVELPVGDAYTDAGGVMGIVVVDHVPGSFATVLGGFALDAAYVFPFAALGIAGRLWQLAPAHDVGGQGGDVEVTLARPLTAVAGLEVRGALGYGSEELEIRSSQDTPHTSRAGLVYRVGIARERRYEAGRGVVFSADLMSAPPGSSPRPTVQVPRLLLGVTIRSHRGRATPSG